MTKKTDATKDIVKYREEINVGVMQNKEVFNALASKTFKGLDVVNIPQALLEGMMRGFTIEDFIKKNVYATPFWNSKKKESKNTRSLLLLTRIERLLRDPVSPASRLQHTKKTKTAQSRAVLLLCGNKTAMNGDIQQQFISVSIQPDEIFGLQSHER